MARIRRAVVCLLAASAPFLSGADDDDAPSSGGGPAGADIGIPVPGWAAPAPGEHPRLFFRKADIPALRRRAATPEGKAVIARLKVLLGGGEAMPAAESGAQKAYSKGGEAPIGAYTISHAAGFGFLYQLTGDARYADLGRQCFERAWAGIRDPDDRYAWQSPGGALRAGPSLGWYAVGYDLCYDGWDDAFRRTVAQRFMDYREKDQGKGYEIPLEMLAGGKRQTPGSNHWGAIVGGGALAALALRGDPGTDVARVERLVQASRGTIARQLTTGWGDHGFFAEGDGGGVISSDTAFIPALQAWRIAGGTDFINTGSHAQWLTMKFVMCSLADGSRAEYPLRGTYGKNVWSRSGMSGSGTFAQGFGAITEAQKPALLWLYQHTYRAVDDQAGAPCDTISRYPHRAVLAFVNWPFGQAERNPGELLPRAVLDRSHGFAMFRNRWQDGQDIVVTCLASSSKGNYAVSGGDILVWGEGRKTVFPLQLSGAISHFAALPAGGVITAGGTGFGCDFSGASGASGLLVMAGSGRPAKGGATARTISAGSTVFTVLTLGGDPAVKADGGALVVGGQAVTWDGAKLAFAK